MADLEIFRSEARVWPEANGPAECRRPGCCLQANLRWLWSSGPERLTSLNKSQGNETPWMSPNGLKVAFDQVPECGPAGAG